MNIKQILNFIILFIFILQQGSCDCPLNRSPRDTIIGFIQVNIDNDPLKHNTNLLYQYNLQTAMSSIPKVCIGIHTMDVYISQTLSYNIMYLPINSPTLYFYIRFFTNSGWNKLKFNFLATVSDLIQSNTIQIQSLVKISNSYNIVTNILIGSKVSTGQHIQLFLSGINVYNNNNAVNGLLEFQISQIKLTNSYLLQFSILVNANTQINLINIHYLIYGDELLKQNYYISNDSFTLTNYVELPVLPIIQLPVYDSNTRYGPSRKLASIIYPTLSFQQKTPYQITISKLDNMDTFFIGFIGIKASINQRLSFNLLLNNQNSVDTSKISIALLDNTSKIKFAYSAFSRKSEYFCKDCLNNPIVFQNFCLNKCPFGYISKLKSGHLQCFYCDITKLLMPNQDQSLCICAKQHYLISDNQCIPCNFRCLTCNNPDTCVSCDTPNYQTKRQLTTNGECICPIGYFDDIQRKYIVCQKCHYSCQSCTAADQKSCIKCIQGRIKDNQGYCVCNKGYISVNGSCICISPKFQINKICIAPYISCNINQQYNTNTLSCECNNRAHKINGKCIICPTNSVFSIETNLCQCSTGYYDIINNQCKVCPQHQIYDSSSQHCICQKNYSRQSNGICFSCPQKSVLISNQCECVYNYYFNGIECTKCLKATDSPNCNINVQS